MLPLAGVTDRSLASAPRRAAPPLRLQVRRGLDLPVDGRPESEGPEAGPAISTVALLGADAPGVRPALRVEPGERVGLGQTLFVDRRRPAVRFTAPGAGVVEAIVRGARRRFEALVIRLEGDAEERFDALEPGAASGARIRETMLASGWWTTLRTRPFSRIPDPEATPHALFVTALESDPLAPGAERIVADHAADFARGLEALCKLTEGTLYLCTGPGAALPLPDLERVRLVEFAGPHPAGLPGTHIHRLAQATVGRVAWHVGYADVITLGGLLATGRMPTARVVSLAGPAVARPRLLRTRIGASTEDLVRRALGDESCRVISGSIWSGRQAVGPGAHLGRLHTQVCAIPERAAPGSPGWWVPGRGGRARRVAAGRSGPGRITTALGGRRAAFFPLERMERVFPFDIPLAPLLRALLVGDVEAVEALGGLELAEEDLALASFLCPAKLDYGVLLRAALDEIGKP